jgi:hypothetical protein
MARNTTAQISSLLATSAARYSQEQEQQAQPATGGGGGGGGMSLDAFYISLGNAARADWQAGLITETQFWNRVAELKSQYRAIKAR